VSDGNRFGCASTLAEPALPALGGGGRLKLGVGIPLGETRHTRFEGWVRAGFGYGWTQGGVCALRERYQAKLLTLRGGDSEVAVRAEIGGIFGELSARGSLFRYIVAGDGRDLNHAIGFLVGGGGAVGYAFRTPVGRPEVRFGLDVVGLVGNWYGLGIAAGLMPHLAIAWRI
jgi:hypothetical protein